MPKNGLFFLKTVKSPSAGDFAPSPPWPSAAGGSASRPPQQPPPPPKSLVRAWAWGNGSWCKYCV